MVRTGVRRFESWWALGACVAALAACGGQGGDTAGYPAPPDPAEPAIRRVADLVGPEGLCFDLAGNLFVGSTTGRIVRVRENGIVSVLAETGRSLAGLATGPQGEIFAAAFTTGEVLAVTPDGRVGVATSGLDSPNGLVIDPNGRTLVSAFGLGGRPQVALIEFDGTFRTLTRQVVTPNGLTFGPDGALYVAETSRNRVLRFDYDLSGTELGTPSVFVDGATLVDGIAFDSGGNLYASGGGNVLVFRNDEQRTRRRFLSPEQGDVAGPASIAFAFGGDRDEGDLYLANYGFPALGSGTSVASTHVGIPGLPLNAP